MFSSVPVQIKPIRELEEAKEGYGKRQSKNPNE
jgi:hypothetical protein